MNVPNILTSLRFFITAGFIYYIVKDDLAARLLATGLFAAAAVTDFFDGYIARRMNIITDFGKLMDPIADKFLVLSAFFMFSYLKVFPFWMFVLIALREVLITVIRLLAVRKGKVLAAEKAGKLKTVVQMAVIIVILIYLLAASAMPDSVGLLKALLLFIFVAMIGVVILTVGSGISFLVNNRGHFNVR